MKTLPLDALEALSARELRVAYLVRMDFPAGAIGLSTTNFDIDYGGLTYRGAAGLGAISQINDSAGEVKGMNFELAGVTSESISLALDESDVVQGTPVAILTGIFDDGWQLLAAEVEWMGRLDVMGIEESGETSSIAVSAESSEVDLLRGTPLTYSDADQKSLFPDDRAFEFVISQVNQRVVWPAKQWLIASTGR